jgi:protein TonB
MAALYDDPFSTRFHPASGRLALAVAASAGGHLCLAALLALEPPLRGAARPAGAAITVHLEPRVPAVPQELLVAPSRSLSATGEERPRAALAVGRETSRRARDAALALPQAPDPTYYAARDLDDYPRLLAPLDLGGLAVDAVAKFRVTLMIDERGVVNEVAAVEPGSGERPREALRAALAGTRFIPGQKDGRAVKSRVVLDISLGPEKREP